MCTRNIKGSVKCEYVICVFSQARNTNGLSTAEDAPYWAKLQEPPQLRRFTEGPPLNQQTATNDEKEPLPTTPQDQTGATVVDQETSQRQAEPVKQTEEAAPDKDHHSEEVLRLMPPPPAPLEKRAVSPAASSSMPPPSFLPPRVASAAESTSSELCRLTKSYIQAMENFDGEMYLFKVL